ncbi:relA-associated inhibitor isoform X1 [Paramormyrops kingsleyae]|uniref:Protein phosphatase 1, regulatory subunit 13 like n=2 Tax=Paramormyrops kingsleyae TaxID=1676925 RepID=A0A3B3SRC5_9TELE|nr:relA-associated inhibitor isoform X1 [Paramormyrops kingsleyae]
MFCIRMKWSLTPRSHRTESEAMQSQVGFTSMMFQSINEDLNASLATADELSREFNSLLQECSPTVDRSQEKSLFPEEIPQKASETSCSVTSSSKSQYTTSSQYTPGSQSQYTTSSQYTPDSQSQYTTSSQYTPGSQSQYTTSSQYTPDSQSQYTPSSPSQYTTSSQYSSSSQSQYETSSQYSPSPQSQYTTSSHYMPSSQYTPGSQSQYTTRSQYTPSFSSRSMDLGTSSPYVPPSPSFPSRFFPSQGGFTSLNRPLTDSSFSGDHLSLPTHSPKSQRRVPPTHIPTYSSGQIQAPRGPPGYVDEIPPLRPHVPAYEQAPRITVQPPPGAGPPFEGSLRRDRSPSPRQFNPSASSTLPRNFMSPRLEDDIIPRQKNPAQWNETDLDVSYERKPHQTYDKADWLRPLVPNNSWRETNLDAAPPSKKLPSTYTSLPRGVSLSGTPDRPSPLLASRSSSTYNPQPIISRISIPPALSKPRRSRPIPLSIIMRLQNPNYPMSYSSYPHGKEGQYQPPLPLPQDYLPLPAPPEQRQPEIYGEVLNPDDVDAELERLEPTNTQMSQNGTASETGGEKAGETEAETVPRPLSPTRLQPVVAPETVEMSEIFRILSEVPRALRRRGSDQVAPVEKPPTQPTSQYKQMIKRFLRRKGDQKMQLKGELESDSNSSSEDEDQSMTPLAPVSPPRDLAGQKGLNSILRQRNRERKTPGRRARLSPLVLLLDGALVGELETVQKALQEMTDPSQPNDEGITALHNAICGGHNPIVDLLVRNGANVSAPDSHGWTPLHCAASCNDLHLCEYLVRNGAAVMAVTESDGATASQKCDPFAVDFEECEGFLRGVEDAMGVDNSGVLYALWSYPAQNPDELSFREGDMVTILQKPEQGDWWWASLCGREGFVPNNYFGLFPKVRNKSLC